MIEFPAATVIHQRLPKEAFYKHLPLTKTLKEKFVSDVDKITLENSFTKERLNLNIDSEVKEILLLSISLKTQTFESKIIEAIAKQNTHKLLFLLMFNNNCQLAFFHDIHGKLYKTKWMNALEVNLKLQGFSLSEIWDAFVEQIALAETHTKKSSTLSVDERLARQEEILKIEKLIKKTEAAAWKEVQSKKQLELHSRLCEYKKQLEALKGCLYA